MHLGSFWIYCSDKGHTCYVLRMSSLLQWRGSSCKAVSAYSNFKLYGSFVAIQNKLPRFSKGNFEVVINI